MKTIEEILKATKGRKMRLINPGISPYIEVEDVREVNDGFWFSGRCLDPTWDRSKMPMKDYGVFVPADKMDELLSFGRVFRRYPYCDARDVILIEKR
jgi:hypothetical protein